MNICRKCDGYGVVPGDGVRAPFGIAMTCQELDCRGYVSSTQLLKEMKEEKGYE